MERARAFAKRLNAPLAIIDKRRTEANVAEVMNIIGDVRGQNCLMVDDLDRYGGHAGEGRGGVAGARARPVFRPAPRMRCCPDRRWSGSKNRDLKEVVVTNSIPLGTEAAALR